MVRHGKNPDKSLDQLIQEFQQEYGDCLDWLFLNLKNPENLGYSNKLIKLFKPHTNVMGGNSPQPIISNIFWFWNGPDFFSKDAKKIKEYKNRIKPKKLALEYLPSNFMEIFPPKFHFNNAIYYKDFLACYFWLERLYFISAGRYLNFDDALNIYFSGTIEKIILGLNEFDKLENIPDPDCEFFNKLGNLSIHENAEKFKKKVSNIINISLKINELEYTLFEEPENQFLDCLASFSAVKSDKTNVSIKDYVIAYKTYYKLLKTDLKDHKCQEELFNDKYPGYIVCTNCASIYELKRGEKPDDFSSCHCQENIIYQKYLKNRAVIKWKYVICYIILLSLILVILFRINNLLYFITLGIMFLILTTTPFSIKEESDKRGNILGSTLIIILSFFLSSFIIKSLFNELGNIFILLLPMGLILTLNLIIISRN